MSHIGSNSLVFPSGLGAGGSDIAISPTAPVAPTIGDLWQNSGTTTDSGIKSGNLAFYDGSTWQKIATYSDPVICSREIVGASQALTSGGITKINWPNAVTDTHGAWSAINNHFIVPEDGIYLIYFRFRMQSILSATGNISAFGDIYVNGLKVENTATFHQYLPSTGILAAFRPHGVGVHGLSNGQTLDIRCDLASSHGTPSMSGPADMQKLKIIKIGEL